MKKEKYERKENYVKETQIENAEIIDKLGLENGDEIIDVLAKITRIRHDMHSSDSMFYPESANGEEQSDFISYINEELYELGLDPIEFSYDISEIATVEDYELSIDKEDYDSEEEYEEAKQKCIDESRKTFMEQKEQINKDIENWLKKFDEDYGTHYKPTGKSRMY